MCGSALFLLFSAFALPALAGERDGRASTVIAENRFAIGLGDVSPSGVVRATGATGAGASASDVTVIVDLRTGENRQTSATGSLVSIVGLSDRPWTSQNGVATVIDMPVAVADNLAQAYALRQGWLQRDDRSEQHYLGRRAGEHGSYDIVTMKPPGASLVEAWFDARTHLLARTIVQTDRGRDTTDYDDYRSIGPMSWPFSTHNVARNGAVTDTVFRDVTFLPQPAPSVFAMPTFTPTGMLSGPASVAFRSASPTASVRIVVPIQLRGRTVLAYFDTGGQNVLTPAGARKLLIAGHGGLAIGGAGSGTVSASIAALGPLRLGGGTLPDQRFLVLPIPYAATNPMRGEQIDALVGAEILENFRVTIDYTHHMLTLRPFTAPPPRGVVVPFVSDNGTRLFVPATIDGARGLFGIDTGDSGTITVFGPFARAHRLYQNRGVPIFGTGVGGIRPDESYRAHRFTLAGVMIANPVIKATRIARGLFFSHTIAGNIGSGILSRFTITIDVHARTITFLPNAAAHDPFCGNETGLVFVPPPGPGPFDVGFVLTGTPAWEAGIRAGDRIVAVNGRSARTLGYLDLNLPCPSHGAPITYTVARGTTTSIATVHPRALL